MKPRLDIYLLKSTEETASKDKYVEYIEQEENRKSFEISEIKLVNLLEFKFVNLNQFEVKLNTFFNPNSIEYSCLIVTSRQVVEAIKQVNLDIHESSKNYQVYCVGEQTSNALRNHFACKYPHLINQLDIRMPSCSKQNASELADLIVNENDSSRHFNALFPCSSIRKDDLILKLRKLSLNIEELTLYETTTSKSGITELINLLSEVEQTTKYESIVNCFVLFSPSCVQSIFDESVELRELLLKLFESNLDFNYFISIGPSTNAKLVNYLNGFNQSSNIIEMQEPSPKGLVKALEIIYSKF